MAAEDLDRSSSSVATNKRSIHRNLGGGFVADVLLWKNRTVAISIAVGATAFWILFDFVGYSVLHLIANTLLLLVSIIFFWAKSATLLNRPLPPIPNLEISDEVVGKAADKFRVWINWVLSVARDIGIGRDRMVFLQVIVVLWVLSTVGSLFSFLTLVYIGVLLTLTVPVLYDKYQDHIEEKFGLVRNVFLKYFSNVVSIEAREDNKKKKAQ